MSGKVTHINSQRKTRSLRAYSIKIFQESSIGVVSTVAHTHSNSRKFFKVLAFLLCLTGFGYQSGKYLSVVFQYPTTIAIDVIRPDTFQVPGYTFCDNNSINRRLFCEKYPERCEKPSEEFCKKYTSYCGKNDTVVPKKQYFSYHHYDFENLVELNEKMENFILKFGRSGEGITGPLFRAKDLEILEYYICYSTNDRVNSSLDPILFTPDKLARRPISRFEFKVRSDEMFLPGNRPGILFAVHSQFEAVNPFETGAFMRPGRTYMVYLSMEKEVLEKTPYDTDCINYTEIWENNKRTGPRLQDMCMHNCISDLSVKCYNCNIPFFYFPREERFCSIDDMENNDTVQSEYCKIYGKRDIEACYQKCKDDCTYTKYRYTVQERFKGHFDEVGNTIQDIDDIIEIEVYIEEDEVKVYKHSPKYMTVEAVSSIGGFIGIWLGMSLLDIAELFESFIRIIQYSLKKIT